MPTMHRQERQAVLRRALVHMARHFGYVWAEEELLQSGAVRARQHPWGARFSP
ncbi:hypothetical protein ACFV7R_34565 [Streptomyces sp. NPDC059866]|uniref:hypothetical protein n=1 Tax=Streptomyces sp. NPDC059866 TaxID=3346978 RepID=UPI00366A517C